MFSSKAAVSNLYPMPIAYFQYPQIMPISVAPVPTEPEPEEPTEPEVRLAESSFFRRLEEERAAGFAEAEASLRQEFQQKSAWETARVSKAIADFEQTRKEYFARVEAEVVQLALTIARKIIHREAQVDPMLVAALVQIALHQLQDGAAASIRVRPQEAQKWREHLTSLTLTTTVKVVEDAECQVGDCVLETELGTVNFSLDAQLKEVEQGFLDVLAQKPQG